MSREGQKRIAAALQWLWHDRMPPTEEVLRETEMMVEAAEASARAHPDPPQSMLDNIEHTKKLLKRFRKEAR